MSDITTPHIEKVNGRWAIRFGPLTSRAHINAAMKWVRKVFGKEAHPLQW